MPSELRVEYHRQLQDIEDTLLEAAYRIAELMPRVSRAWTRGDASIAAEAAALRADVAQDCERVEDECFRLMATQTPVAGDLRTIVTLLRLVTHVDRSSALLSHVAASTDQVDTEQLPGWMMALVQDLAERSAEVFRLGLDAWRARDLDGLVAVNDADEGVDQLQVQILGRAQEHELANDALVSIGLLVRYYERIADHGVAFSRDVAFVVTGRRRREDAG